MDRSATQLQQDYSTACLCRKRSQCAISAIADGWAHTIQWRVLGQCRRSAHSPYRSAILRLADPRLQITLGLSAPIRRTRTPDPEAVALIVQFSVVVVDTESVTCSILDASPLTPPNWPKLPALASYDRMQHQRNGRRCLGT